MVALPYRILLVGILTAMGLQSLAAAESSNQSSGIQPMVYLFWDWQQTPKRDNYMVSLLDLVLAKTTDKYGPYKIIRKNTPYSTSRVRREIARGIDVNIQGAPWRPLEQDTNFEGDTLVRIDFSILKGLLGCRRLIIRKTDQKRFENIHTLNDLRGVTAGIGKGWADAEIFKNNRLPVNDEGNATTLFSMLASGRFDYYPLSILEAEDALNANPSLNSQFMVAPDILIYYPLPMVYYVSGHDPRLAKRVEDGLKMADADGSVDKLLLQFFSRELAALSNPNKHLFRLANAGVPNYLEAKNAMPEMREQ